MKHLKATITLLLTLLAFIIFSSTSNATENVGFDANYYATKYPDVVNALGNDPNVLYNHYITYGLKEGRFINQYEEENDIVNSLGLNTESEFIPVLPVEGYSTYIDVSISGQLVTYFEDGAIKFQSPCVTGLANGKRDTPTGTYSIKCKIPGKRLKGPTWDCWVNRWMRFTDSSIGFHDATWRSNFGGEIYKTNGSHGCVNLPKDKAYELYDLIEVGTVVIVHD
jgi:lipoprotein-anchoring transpeptidase ErfK/SrfK